MGHNNNNIERITYKDITYAIIIKTQYNPEETEFVTEKEYLQQIGFIVKNKGDVIPSHRHKPSQRIIEKTTETLFVKKGKIEYQIFNNDRNLISNGLLDTGDIITLLDGGHGFNIIEDAILIEVKQGPFISTKIDKERFNSE